MFELLRRLFSHGLTISEDDNLCRKMIVAARLVGAKTAREAAEVAARRPFSDEEWESLSEIWERNWIEISKSKFGGARARE